MRLFLACLFVSSVASCAPDAPISTSTQAPPSASSAGSVDVARQVRDLISALTPPPATSNSAIMSAFYNRRREMLESMRDAGPEVGRAVYDEYQGNPDAILDVRRGLLEVAAFAAPGMMEAELVHLVENYGEHLGLRTKACELLADTHPAKAVAVLEPFILEPRPGVTLPPADIMVMSYSRAARACDYDAIDTLTSVATNLFIDETARQFAVREVAKFPGARAREAIRILMIESTGNAYLRRDAVKAFVEHSKIDPETKAILCDTLLEVTDKETDVNFQVFMINVVEKYCGDF
jgi:hypothetical protein